jgi:hypothetical protein
MARKSKGKSKGRSPRRSPREAAPAPKLAQQAAPPQRRDEVDFRSEYHYVYSDLRNIGILASIMFVVLIALALMVRV